MKKYNMSELKSERKKKGLTQAQMAELFGVTRQSYCSYENGRAPDIDLLIRLSVFFDRPIDALIGIDKNKQFKQHPVTPLQQELLNSSRGLDDAAMRELITYSKKLRTAKE